jgi:hypothetical protein
LCLQHLNKVFQTFTLCFLGRDGGHHIIIQRFRRITPLNKPIISFLLLILILRDAGIFRYDVLRHFHKHRHLVIQPALFFL